MLGELWSLWITFFKIGCVTFGGGYAAIPAMQYETAAHRWMTGTEFQEAISLAGMAPGPIAVNGAALIGFDTAGIVGAIVAVCAMILPSFIVVVALAAIFRRLHNLRWLRETLYGLRPVVVGLIAYAAVHYGFLGGHQPLLTWATAATALIAAGSVYAMAKYRLHPLTLVVVSGIAGIVLF